LIAAAEAGAGDVGEVVGAGERLSAPMPRPATQAVVTEDFRNSRRDGPCIGAP